MNDSYFERYWKAPKNSLKKFMQRKKITFPHPQSINCIHQFTTLPKQTSFLNFQEITTFPA